MEKLSLKKYLELCLDFEENPSEENRLKIADFLGSLTIKSYMSLGDKAINSIKIINTIQEGYDAATMATFLEMYKIYYGLFAYVVNLDVDLGILNNNYAVYDKCYEHGLIDYILGYCEQDYLAFSRYCENMLNICNIEHLMLSFSLMNENDFNKWAEEIKALRKELTPEFLRAIEGYTVGNSESMEQVTDDIIKQNIGLSSYVPLTKEKLEGDKE